MARDPIRRELSILRSYIFYKNPVLAPSCSYCGQPATDEEHVWPRSHLLHLRELGAHPDEVVTPACRECNVLAGDKVFDTFEEKRNYIHDAIKARYRNLLRMPEWTPHELRQLKGKLRRFVEGSLQMRNLLKERIAWDQEPVLIVKGRSRPPARGNASALPPAETVTIPTVSLESSPTVENKASPSKLCIYCKSKIWAGRRQTTLYCSPGCGQKYRALLKQPSEPILPSRGAYAHP